MFLVLLCIYSSASSETVAIICKEAQASDCITAANTDIQKAFGFALEDSMGIKYETSYALSGLAPTISKVIIIAKTAGDAFSLSDDLPPTVTYIGIVGAVAGTTATTALFSSIIGTTITLAKEITVNMLALNNVKLTTATNKIEVAGTLDLQTGASFDASSISTKENTITTVITSVDLTNAAGTISFDSGKITVLTHEIPNTKVHLKVNVTDSTKAITINGTPDVGSELNITVDDTSKQEVKIVLDNAIASADAKCPKLFFVAKNYIALSVTPPSNPGVLNYTVLSSINSEDSQPLLLDQYPISSPVAICVSATSSCTSRDTYITPTQLFKVLAISEVATKKGDFKKSGSFTFILPVENTDSTLIDISGYIGADKNITIAADVNSSVIKGFFKIETVSTTTSPAKMLTDSKTDYNIKSLTIKNVNTIISGIDPKSPITVSNLDLQSGGLNAESMKIDNNVVINSKIIPNFNNVTLMKNLTIKIENPPSGKNLTFNGDGWKYDDVANVAFSDKAFKKPLEKTIFEIEYSSTTNITVKASPDVALIPLIVTTAYKTTSAVTNGLLEDSPKMKISIDKESWDKAKKPEEGSENILNIIPDSYKNIDLIGKENMGPYQIVVKGAPPNSEPEPKGLSTGAIVGIAVACVAVVAGICVGVFFYIKKSKARVKGAVP